MCADDFRSTLEAGIKLLGSGGLTGFESPSAHLNSHSYLVIFSHGIACKQRARSRDDKDSLGAHDNSSCVHANLPVNS
jgi:hypothetical protein